jgi:hypothetical protein
LSQSYTQLSFLDCIKRLLFEGTRGCDEFESRVQLHCFRDEEDGVEFEETGELSLEVDLLAEV